MASRAPSGPGANGRKLAAWCPALAIAAALAPGQSHTADSLETAVKASYLYKVAPFVGWPLRPAGDAVPFTICVVGRDPFGAILDRAVAGQRLGDRPMTVMRLGAVQTDSPCQIAFIGGSRAQAVRQALRALHGAPVLTVTDGEGDGAAGIIDFVVIDGRVRFRVDDQAAAENALTISSKLLSLAVSVRTRQGAEREQ